MTAPGDAGMEAIRRRAEELSRGPEAGAALDDWVRAEVEYRVAHRYDTLEHDLWRLGLELVRSPSEAGVVWRLRLPRGELVEAWEPGTEGLAPPAEVMALIAGILAGRELVPESPVLREPGGARLREALTEQLSALRTHEPGVRLGTDSENLHQHRVAARRASAFLRAARAYVEPAWACGMKELLRDHAAVTGPVRDLDVLIEHAAGELADLGPEDGAGAGSLLAALASARTARRAALLEALDGERYRLLLTRLRYPPRLRPDIDDVPLGRLARKEFRRLARAVERLGPNPDDRAIHGLRIALKRARYAAELAEPTRKATRRFVVAAKALQDLLGEHQDSVVAETALRATTVHDDPTAAAFVAGRLAERQLARRRRVDAELRPAWRRLRRRAADL